LINQICLAQTDSIAKQRERASADSAVNAILLKNKGERKLLAVSTDVLLDAWAERNLSAEGQLSDNVAIGCAFSMFYHSSVFQVNPLASQQWSWPGNIYNGSAERLYVKYYPDKKSGNQPQYVYEHPKKSRGYWCFQVDAKQMYYTDHVFVDEDGDIDFNTLATGNQNVVDFVIFHGHEAVLSKYFFLDFFYGLGFRMKWINQTITGVYVDNTLITGNTAYGTVGTTNYFKSLPFPEIGFKIGFTLPHSFK
jgi:hypothetical protein